jgi:hypothetical protein
MKIAVQIIAYNEEETIAATIKNWLGKVHTITVFHSDKPWHGQDLPHDKTQPICEALGVKFIRLPWISEAEQRNWALAYHYEFDYVLIVDADELYTEEDQDTILRTLGNPPDDELHDNLNCYRVPKVRSYFKGTDYVLDPPDTHKPLLAVNPKKVIIRRERIPSQDYEINVPVTLHHVSYLRNEKRFYHKLQQFEHHHMVNPRYFFDTFKPWKPGDETVVRAYGQEKSKAIFSPMPQELIALLDFSRSLLARV